VEKDMRDLLQDVRYAIRVLAKRPGFTAIAIVTLALGIGVNSLMFSLVDAVLFRPLPVRAPERLLRIGTTFGSNRASSGISYPLLKDFREQSDAFVGLAGFSGGNIVHVGANQEQPERVPATVVSGNFFSLLGVGPTVGRLISEADDATPGGHPVLVLSDAYWKRRFGADPRVVGSSVRMNSHAFTVVGVAPAGFHGVDLQDVPDVWIPVSMLLEVSPNLAQFKPFERRGFAWLEGIARLEDGVTPEQGAAQLNTIRSRVARELKVENAEQERVTATPVAASTFSSEGRQNVRRISWVLMGVALMVLLIACAVASGLLLVRAEQRQREVAVRFAVGATRSRVMRQLLTESLLLSGAGAVLGVLLAVWGADIFRAVSTDTFPLPVKASSPVLASRVLWLTGLLALASTALFGWLPAWTASRTSLMDAMKRDSGFRHGRSRRVPLREAFVVTQVALSAMLLVGAGLLLRTLGNAAHVDLGFDTRNALAISVDVSKSGYTRERGRQFYDELLARVHALPGVTSAAISRLVPVGDPGMATSVEVTHFTAPEGQEPMVAFTSVTPDYFETLGLRLERGRDFDARDGAESQVIIVNRAFADRFWPGLDPLQQRVVNFGDKGSEVVGVVSDARLTSIRDTAVPMLYVPFNAFYTPNTNLLLKTRGDAGTVLAAVRSIVQQLDRSVPLYRVRTLEEQVALSLGQERMIAGLLSAFAALALVLAAVGLYGVISYATQIRTKEFGVRMALGAIPADVVRLVVAQGTRLAILGVAIGLAAAALASRVLSTLLFGVSPTDSLTYGCIGVVLLLVALAASAIPALRASLVSPVKTLRYE
jgi:predicted permease